MPFVAFGEKQNFIPQYEFYPQLCLLIWDLGFRYLNILHTQNNNGVQNMNRLEIYGDFFWMSIKQEKALLGHVNKMLNSLHVFGLKKKLVFTFVFIFHMSNVVCKRQKKMIPLHL